MKKALVILSLFFSLQYCYAYWPFDETGNSIGVKTSEKLSKDGAETAAAGGYLEKIGTVIDIFRGIIYVGSTVKQFCSEKKEDNRLQDLENQDSQVLCIARKQLVDLIYKNADGEIGSYGLPKACDQVVRKLVLLSGGREVLQEIKAIFQEYFVSSKQKSKEQEQKLPEQQPDARGSVLAKMFFWKKATSLGAIK